ncbi:MAG: hypothetical protein R3A52_04070 [Polyangiales bacterium]
MQWLERVGERVTRVRMSVDRVAASPDGSLLAFFAHALGGPEELERRPVHVIELSTGREVVRMDDPGVPRDLAWVDDDALLIARDDRAEGARLCLHAIPDGGVAAVRRLGRGNRSVSLELSADRRRALVDPMYLRDSRPQPNAVVLALPTLTPLLEISPESFGHTEITDAHLSDDGAWALVVRDWMRLSVLSVDRPAEEPVTFLACDSGQIMPTWVSPSRAVYCAADAPYEGSELSLIDLSTWAVTSLPWSQPYELPNPGVSAHPDRHRIAGFLESTTEPSQRALRLTVLDVNDWTAVAEHENARIEAFCWTRDGGALLTAERVARVIRVERWSPDDGRRAVIAEVALDASFYEPSLATAGDGAALLQWSRDAIVSEAALIDLAP